MPKYLLSAFFVLLFCANTFAQKVYFSTPINTGVYSIKKTADKGYLIFGWSYENRFQKFTKIDKKGNIQWQKSFDIFFYPDNVYRTINQNFILHGSVEYNYSSFIQGNSLLCVNQLGDSLWQTKPNNNETNTVNFKNVCIESDGTTDMIKSDSLYNVFLEKYNNNGIRIANKLIPNFKAFTFYGFIQTSINSFVFISSDTAHYISTNRLTRFTCIDSMGNILWNKEFLKDTFIYNLMFIKNTIYTFVYLRDSVTSKNDLSCYVYDLNGNILNKKQLISQYYFGLGYNGQNSESIKDGFYFFVNFNSYDTVTNYNFTNSQLFKVDENLNIKWTLTFNNPIQCIDTGNCNSIIIGFANNGSYGSTIESIKDPELDEVCDKCENTVFPNPTTETFFNIKSNLPDVFIDNVEVFDYAGKSVWNSFNSINSNFFMLNNNLSDGIYLCRIGCDNGKQQVKKVVIAK